MMAHTLQSAVQIVIVLLGAFLNPANGIIGRDLVLTPKHGFQFNGKSIYYEEESNEVLRNQSARPWERTLKHVTYVTIFTNAAADAVAGNLSKLKEYTDFLHSPYIGQQNESDARFGDIVTLASGRLEATGNRTYRFVEGTCDYGCEAERVWALWQVQKIRHRDINRTFRYEMKFSVSPLRPESEGTTTIKRGAEEESYRRNGMQTYIQKEDDYPQSFGRIIYPEETSFVDRRQDENNMGRNFRQASANDYRQVTPIPRSTFTQIIYQTRPQMPLASEQLNIGEYLKGFPVRATPKIEVFPNVHNQLVAGRNPFPTPTTYRPNYHVKFPRPEIYQPQQHKIMKFPENSQEHLLGGKLRPPLVTHHFHHHFFMPSGSSGENALNSAEQQLRSPSPAFKDEVDAVTPYFHENFYNKANLGQHQLPQKVSFSTPPSLPEVEEHQVVRVTPVPPLGKPQMYEMYPIRIGPTVPLLIYPAPVEEEVEERSTPRNKPFMQSEQLDLRSIRYSEPDPLYLNVGNRHSEEQSYELNASQLEAPKSAQYEEYANERRLSDEVQQHQHNKPDSIAAQLPPPDKNQDVRVPYVDDIQEVASNTKNDLEENPSQKNVKISTEKTTSTSTKTQEPATVETKTTSTTTPESITLTEQPLEVLISSTTKEMSSSTSFVSTSTTETPLRSVIRHHRKRITSTTEKPVLKWKPRRKSKSSSTQIDNNAKSSSRHEQKLIPSSEESPSNVTQQPLVNTTVDLMPQETLDATTTTEAVGDDADTLTLPQNITEIFEVLTQKSVSKSVSIKVGNNGEEIPIIIDDEENEVKRGE